MVHSREVKLAGVCEYTQRMDKKHIKIELLLFSPYPLLLACPVNFPML